MSLDKAMSKALKEIHRRQALIEWRCTSGDIRLINEPLREDIVDLRAALDALDHAFQKEGKAKRNRDDGRGRA